MFRPMVPVGANSGKSPSNDGSLKTGQSSGPAVPSPRTVFRPRMRWRHQSPSTPAVGTRDGHQKCALVYYNLACYASVNGTIPEAKLLLDTALGLEPGFRAQALEDPALAADWEG